MLLSTHFVSSTSRYCNRLDRQKNLLGRFAERHHRGCQLRELDHAGCVDQPRMRSVNFFSSRNKELFTNAFITVNPRGLAVDPLQGKLYWSDWNRKQPKIESSNLDGSERKLILSSPDVKLPNSLALSLTSGELCYADAGNQKIACMLFFFFVHTIFLTSWIKYFRTSYRH